MVDSLVGAIFKMFFALAIVLLEPIFITKGKAKWKAIPIAIMLYLTSPIWGSALWLDLMFKMGPGDQLLKEFADFMSYDLEYD